MIVDFHTHVFPPSVIASREDYLRHDRGFAAIYSNPAARMVTAEELVASMDAAGVDVSVVLNFAWRDPGLCAATNDYLLEQAVRAGGRLIPFVMIQPAQPQRAARELERCIAGGAAGVGELRPDDQGYDLAAGSAAEVLREAGRRGLVLLFHVSEPVGHLYPGKEGLSLPAFVAFARASTETRIVAAHWGGGLPFYLLMPEIRRSLEHVWFDSAASRLLYDNASFTTVAGLAGAERILWGSDYPLLAQLSQRRLVEESGLTPEQQGLALGGNAASLLRLSTTGRASG